MVMLRESSMRKLVKEAQRGDVQAAEEIINRFKPAIKKYSNSVSANREDVCQDLIVWTIEAIQKYKPKKVS